MDSRCTRGCPWPPVSESSAVNLVLSAPKTAALSQSVAADARSGGTNLSVGITERDLSPQVLNNHENSSPQSWPPPSRPSGRLCMCLIPAAYFDLLRYAVTTTLVPRGTRAKQMKKGPPVRVYTTTIEPKPTGPRRRWYRREQYRTTGHAAILSSARRQQPASRP